MEQVSHKLHGLVPFLLLLALYYAAGLLASPKPVVYDEPVFLGEYISFAQLFSNKIISTALAAVMMVLTCVVLLMLNNLFNSASSPTAPVVYLMLVIANPLALYCSPYHFAAFFLAVALYYQIKYCTTDLRVGSVGIACCMLVFACGFVPPLIWMFPIVLLINLKASEEKWKYVAASFAGFLVPLLLFFSVEYLFSNMENASSILIEFWRRTIAIPDPVYNTSIVTIIRYLLVVVAAIAGAGFIIRGLNTCNTAKYRSAIRILTMTVPVVAIVVLFAGNSRMPAGLVAFLLPSLILNNYFQGSESRRFIRLLLAAALVIMALERAMLLLKP